MSGDVLSISSLSVQEYWEEQNCYVCCCTGNGRIQSHVLSDYNSSLKDRRARGGGGGGQTPPKKPLFFAGILALWQTSPV